MPPELRALIDGSRDAVRRVIVDLREKAEAAEQLRVAEHRAFMAEQREALAGMQAKAEDRIAAVRNGVDGRDGRDGTDAPLPDVDAFQQIVTERVAQFLADAPMPQDGKDGRDGNDGTSVALSDIEPVVAAAVAAAVAALPVARDGRDGTDGTALVGAVIDRNGLLVLTLSDGTLRELGQVVGTDGRDGANGASIKGDPGEPGRDGSNGTSVEIAELEPLIAEQVQRAVSAIPRPIDGRDGLDGRDAYPGSARGLFDPEAVYRALDVVSFNGCEWRAKRDDPGDLPGDGWMLSASRGKPGGRGETGREGPRGKDGMAIIAGYVDPSAMQLTLTRDDGSELKIDLYDFADLIRRTA